MTTTDTTSKAAHTPTQVIRAIGEWIDAGSDIIHLDGLLPHSEDDVTFRDAIEEARKVADTHDELVAALSFYVSICGNTCHQVSRETASEMYEKARQALARAEGREA